MEKPRETAAAAKQHVESGELLSRLGLRWSGAAAILAALLFFWIWLFLDVPMLGRGGILMSLFRPEDLIGTWLGRFGHGQPPLGFFDRWPIVFAAGFILLASLGPGSLLVSLLSSKAIEDKLEHFVLSLGAGLNLTSLYVLGGGMSATAALHQPWWIWLGLLVGLLLFPIMLWRLFGGEEVEEIAEEAVATKPKSWLERYGLIFVGLLSLPYLFGGMSPPRDFDVREYHLQAPKEWMQRGQIDFLPHNIYANMPLGAELHAITATTILGAGDEAWWLGGLAGKLIVSLFAPLTALLLWCIGRRLGNLRVGLIAAACYLTLPWVAHVSLNGLNDAVLGYYLLACWWVWWRSEPGDWRAMLLSGYFAGAAAAIKYPAAIFVVMPLVIETLLRKLGLRGRERVRGIGTQQFGQAAFAMILLFLGGMAGGGLWYFKNAHLTGNPVYPLLAKSLGGETRTPEKDARWVEAHAVPQDAAGRLDNKLRSLAVGDQNASPLLLPLLLLGSFYVLQQWWLQPRQPSFPLLALGLAAFIFVGWYLLTHRLDRFLVPAMPLVALLAAYGYLLLREQAGTAIARGFLALGLIYSVSFICGFNTQADARWFVALKQLREDPDVSKAEIEQLVLRLSPGMRWLNNHLKSDEGVLLVGDAAVWDLNGKSQATNVYYNTCFDDCVLLNWRLNTKTAAEFRQEFESRNVRYVCVNWAELRRYLDKGNYGYDRRLKAQESLSLFNNFENSRVLKHEISLGDEIDFHGFAKRPQQVIYRVLTAAEASAEEAAAAAERRQKAAIKNIKPTPAAEPPKSANQSSTSESRPTND